MLEKTKKIIHECLIRSYELGHDAMSTIPLLEYFKGLLENEESSVPDEDKENYSLFIRLVERSLDERTHSSANKELAENVIVTIYSISDWVCEISGKCNHLMCTAREKPLESELTKAFNRASVSSTEPIKDRISILCVFLENDIEKLYQLTNIIIGIISGLNRAARHEFTQWLEANPSVSQDEKKKIYGVLKATPVDRGNLHGIKGFNKEDHPDLEVPTASQCLYQKFFKDYIASPKSNTYQGLQGVFRFDSLGSLYVEIRFLTAKMSDNADYGLASHDIHKQKQALQAAMTTESKEEQEEEKNKSLFHIYKSESERVKMAHFKGYKKSLSDRLHIYQSEVFHCSSHH